MYHTHCITSLPELDEAQRQGPLTHWGAVMSADPTATFFQGPAWCMEWYRCYDDMFQPLVASVRCGDMLVGIVPMAIERSTRRLTFASDSMSDYRDVVAIPEHRKLVVAELLRIYRAGNFPNPLQLGPMQPESETAGIALTFAGASAGVRMIVRSHSSWRWWFTDGAAVKKLTSKKSVRQPLAHYKRQGPLALERIGTSEAWESIREGFFEQHSLRQLYTERPMSFNDPRKRAFYDALFRKYRSSMHVTALRVGDRILAMHFGYTWKDVLYWGAPAFDITEERHSPGLVLLALVMQSAEASGLRGVDLTLGVEEYKKRFSNEHVELPTVEVYSRARQYYARRLRDGALLVAKASISRLRSPEAWERIRQAGKSMVKRAQQLSELGAGTGSVRRATNAIVGKTEALIFVAKPSDVRAVTPSLADGDSCECRRDRVTDLVKGEDGDKQTAGRIAVTVRRVPELLRHGHTLHTLLMNDQLVGWGWSYLPQEAIPLLETKTSFKVEARSVALHAVQIIPKYGGRQLYEELLARILKERFAEGAERAYLVCVGADMVSRGAIEKVGFRLIRIDKLTRLLGRERGRQKVGS